MQRIAAAGFVARKLAGDGLLMTDAPTSKTRAVVLCDPQGVPRGTMGVLEAHRGAGTLHKAFSVFVFDAQGATVLLQRRSRQKKLFPLRWANTCCSHPLPGEEPLVHAAARRLREEFGFTVALREAGTFVYRAEDTDNELSEYEHDTVFVGLASDGITLAPDSREIADWRWAAIADLQRDLRRSADEYAPWLPEALRVALTALRTAP